MIRGQMCARVGCGDTNTKPYTIAGRGGKAYSLYLCDKHHKDLIVDETLVNIRIRTLELFVGTLEDYGGLVDECFTNMLG